MIRSSLAAGSQGGIRGLAAEQILAIDRRAARHQADQDAMEADPARDSRAMTAQRMHLENCRDGGSIADPTASTLRGRTRA
jgi:hypothetical protein